VKRIVALIVLAVLVFPGSAAASRGIDGLAIDAQGRITVMVPTTRTLRPAVIRLTSSGTLDSTFAEGGILRPPVAGARARMAVRPSGALVIAGNRGKKVVLRRFRADGSAVRSFGEDGSAVVTSGGPAEAVLAQPDGHLIALATTACLPQSCEFIYRNLEVRRYAPNGNLLHRYRLSKEDWSMVSAAFEPGGGFVVTGLVGEGEEGTYDRFRPNGGYEGGVVVAPPPSSPAVSPGFYFDPPIADFTVDAQGALVTAPRTLPYEAAGPEVWRRHPDGSMDSSFGAGGRAICEVAPGRFGREPKPFRILAASPGGQVVAASDSADCWLVRFLADGALDSSFGGGDGRVPPDPRMPRPQALILAPDGGILLAGWDRGTSSVRLLRYRADGTSDDAFGVAGMAVVPVAAG
jgi:uncharacterized delta-60 repeat protein